MKILKKLFRSLLVLCVCLNLAACSDQSWALKSDKVSITMGVYIYFLSNAFSEASSKIDKEPYYGMGKKTSILNETLDDKKVSDWMKDKAIQDCKDLISVEKKFDEVGLSLSDEDMEQINLYADRIWNQYGKVYEKLGVSKESYVRASSLFAQKKQKLFEAIYGKDGTEAVTDEELEEYYRNNNANVSIIKKSLVKKSDNSQDDQIDNEGMESSSVEQSDEIGDAAGENESQDNMMSDEEVEEVRKKFEGYVSDINSDDNDIDIAKIGETFKSEEELEKDPVETQVVSLGKSEYSSYPDEVIEAIKSLEVSKATCVNSQNTYYLIVKNDISSDVEKIKEDQARLGVLYQMKSEDFDEKIDEWSNQNEYKLNNRGMNEHSPAVLEKKLNLLKGNA